MDTNKTFEYMMKVLLRKMESDRWLVNERLKADKEIIEKFGNGVAREVMRMKYGYE